MGKPDLTKMSQAFEDPPASRIARAATVAAWAALGAAAAWTVAAAGWMLLALRWRRELFVPEAARSTAAALALAAAWALAVFAGFRLWARHNYRRYYLRNRRKLEPMPLSAPRPGWAEAVLTAEGTVSAKSRAAALRSRGDLRSLSAARLVSLAAVLMRESDARSAAGLLRLALSDPKAGPALRGSAARLLCACAARLGRAGEEAASAARRVRALERLCGGPKSAREYSMRRAAQRSDEVPPRAAPLKGAMAGGGPRRGSAKDMPDIGISEEG